MGHGKGPSRKVVPLELAELAVYLSGVLINFLVKQHLRKMSTEAKAEVEPNAEDIPF